MFSSLTFWEWAFLGLTYFTVATVGVICGALLVFLYD